MVWYLWTAAKKSTDYIYIYIYKIAYLKERQYADQPEDYNVKPRQEPLKVLLYNFKIRGYPENVLDKCISKIILIKREDLLLPKSNLIKKS